ncbi:uncharacterized protein TrAtP1_003254 [Trichoderma atroviride]|uniref:uncharacterized protein n=1 Tax=Hypocrea atroviridis TaxID=63577 RepID=UPI00331AF061|nr:hypothetical protein TrAtP1_003254 [Trichoderma atroviride]
MVHATASGYLTPEYPVGEAQVPRYQPSTEIPRPNPSPSPALESQPAIHSFIHRQQKPDRPIPSRTHPANRNQRKLQWQTNSDPAAIA